MLASCSQDGLVRVWHVPDGGLASSTNECLHEFAGHGKIANLVKWHPTAKDTLGSTGADNKFKIWDVNVGGEV